MERLRRAGQFAELTGVSIRALHHYDQLGLLRPTGRSDAGYRLYSERDLLRLQQVLTLRYLGFPLRQIASLLDRPDFDLVASLRIQRGALRDRIAELERIEATLTKLLDRRLATGRWAWNLVAGAVSAVQRGLTTKGDTMNAYYTPEQRRRRRRPPGDRLRLHRTCQNRPQRPGVGWAPPTTPAIGSHGRGGGRSPPYILRERTTISAGLSS